MYSNKLNTNSDIYLNLCLCVVCHLWI